MFVWHSKYVDFKGTEREEDVMFHYSTDEILSIMASKNEGFLEWMKTALSTNNTAELMPAFRQVVLGAYGEISPDGRRFIKSPEMSKAFSETPMFTQLIESFFADTQNAVEFFNKVGAPVEKQRTAPKIEDYNSSTKS